MGKDYYAILSCAKDANEDAIKKAYRKQALKWHPDRNPQNKEEAETKFKEIAEAFDVLSDTEKRKIYDVYGEEGLKGGPPPGPSQNHPNAANFAGEQGFGYTFRGDPNEIFAQFFKGGMRRQNSFGEGFGSLGGDVFDDFFVQRGGRQGKRATSPRRTQVTQKLPCTLEEIFHGTTKKLKVSRDVSVTNRPREKVLEVQVKPGWKAGTKVTFEGEGDDIDRGHAQDIVFVIQENKHPNFTREGANLIHNVKIPLVDALTGFKVDVHTLDNRILRISVKDIVTQNFVKIVKGEGMPHSKNNSVRGDLLLTFDIEFPKSLSDSQKEVLKSSLPRL